MIHPSHVESNIYQSSSHPIGSGHPFRFGTVCLNMYSSSKRTQANTYGRARGTPNSGFTSMSALSTTAIKDGHQGHAPPHNHTHTISSCSTSSTNTLDAERADRISRLAGLERVATLRGTAAHLTPGASAVQQQQQQPPPGYFDNIGHSQGKERSTVGSASATGSAGARTTWASGSDMYEADKMSEDQEDGVSSSAGLSDEGNASLVGFGETASSTISGPVSKSSMIRSTSGFGSPAPAKATTMDEGSPMQSVQEEEQNNVWRMKVKRTTSTEANDVSMTGQGHEEDVTRNVWDNKYRAGHSALESPNDVQGLGSFYVEGK